MGYSILNAKFAAIVTGIVFTSATLFILRRKKREARVPSKWKQVGHVQKLFIYPLKSGHYNEIDCAECTDVGFRMVKTPANMFQLRDRSFVVYDETTGDIKSGKVITCLVQIRIAASDENHITLDTEGMETLHVQIPEKTKESKLNVKDWQEAPIEAYDCGDEAAKWLSQKIAKKDRGFRLGYSDATKRRDIMSYHDYLKHHKFMSNEATGLFSDFTSMLLMNQASVDDFLKRAPNAKVTMMNFRPNIIVNDPSIKPYEEDTWEWLKIGEELLMRNVKYCTRCFFTTIDQETGMKEPNREPLRTLSKYRMSTGGEKGAVLGIHLELKKSGVIKTGDPIYVGYN